MNSKPTQKQDTWPTTDFATKIRNRIIASNLGKFKKNTNEPKKALASALIAAYNYVTPFKTTLTTTNLFRTPPDDDTQGATIAFYSSTKEEYHFYKKELEYLFAMFMRNTIYSTTALIKSQSTKQDKKGINPTFGINIESLYEQMEMPETIRKIEDEHMFKLEKCAQINTEVFKRLIDLLFEKDIFKPTPSAPPAAVIEANSLAKVLAHSVRGLGAEVGDEFESGNWV